MQSCNRSVKKVYTCIHARARRKIFLHISLPNIVKLFSICNMAKFKKFKKKIFFFFFLFYIYILLAKTGYKTARSVTCSTLTQVSQHKSE